MKKTILTLGIVLSGMTMAFGQPYVNTDPGVGNGFRLYGSDHYKLHLGYGSDYYYGPVQNWAIKMNNFPSGSTARGWVWGVSTPGVAPVAALNILGDMQIKKNFVAEGKISLGSQNVTSTNYDLNVRNTNGKIAFGDNNFIGNPLGGVNCFVGEWGTGGTDTDILQNHGKKGIKFTVDNYQNGEIEAMFIARSGNIGMGTQMTTGYRLSVEGKVRAREIEVNALTWADFVFEQDYKLNALSEVEKYIQKNKHLPDVPSAKEVEENGINLGEMDAILLRKIEELTLYVIEQENRIKELEKQ